MGVGEGTSLSLLSAGGLCPGTQDTPALAETRSDRAPPPRWQLWEAAGSLRKPLVDGKTTHLLRGGRFLACTEEAPGGTQQATAFPPPSPGSARQEWGLRPGCKSGSWGSSKSRPPCRCHPISHSRPRSPTQLSCCKPSPVLGQRGCELWESGVSQEESGGPS